MSEWINYDGSDEQISLLITTKDKFLLLMANILFLISQIRYPLADMISQQCRTGQPVWIKFFNQSWQTRDYEFIETYIEYSIYKTTTPDWNIPGAENNLELPEPPK